MVFLDLHEPDATWFVRAESIHRQLRPQLPRDYVAKMARVFAGGGRMSLAVTEERVLGLAVWRSAENTFAGKYMYVDDLVTDSTERSKGVGRGLIAHCEALARKMDCVELVLDSGVQRADAHRFYFRERFAVTAFNFTKNLEGPPQR